MSDDSGEGYFEDRKGSEIPAEPEQGDVKSKKRAKGPKKTAGASQAGPVERSAKKKPNKKRKRESTQGTKYVRNNALVIGESAVKDTTELELEKTLFGDSDIIERLGGEIPKPDTTDSSKSLEDKLHDIEGVGTSARQRKRRKTEQDLAAAGPAWVDDDDQQVKIDIGAQERAKKLRKDGSERGITGEDYQSRLREQRSKMTRSNVAWADVALLEEKKRNQAKAKKRGQDSDASDVESDDEETPATFQDAEELMKEALRSTAAVMTRKDAASLEAGKLSIARVRDANFFERTAGVVQCMEFHPNGQIALFAGLDKSLRLFEIDGRQNPHLQTIFFDDMPIFSAHFTPDGKEVIVSGNKPYFYVYDIMANRVDKVSHITGAEKQRQLKRMLISPDNKYIVFIGDNGEIILLSNKTKQWVSNLKMSTKIIHCACFTSDGKQLYVAGKAGEIFVWDMDSLSCVRRYRDEGAMKVTCIAISQDGQYQAIGQDSGVVNIYRMSDPSFQTKNPKPMKVIMNLTTPIEGVKFNHDAQMLAIWASDKRNQLRIVHLPSGTVFSNWPREDIPLKRVWTVEFSTNSAYVAIGNVQGHALLFKLHHFYGKS